jgi:hypothetical protein
VRQNRRGVVFDIRFKKASSARVTEIYDTLIAIRSQISRPDARHTWFQEPLKLEDAYGRIFPIPTEYDYKV